MEEIVIKQREAQDNWLAQYVPPVLKSILIPTVEYDGDGVEVIKYTSVAPIETNPNNPVDAISTVPIS